MKSSARKVFTVAVVFALTMGALQHGGWWWACLAATGWALTGFRLPRLTPVVKLFGTCWRTYKLRQERKRLVRQQRRAMRRHQ